MRKNPASESCVCARAASCQEAKRERERERERRDGEAIIPAKLPVRSMDFMEREGGGGGMIR